MVVVSVTPEIALDESCTYTGGLGVLEGDKFYTVAKLKLDYIVLTLFYRKGYIDYEFHDDALILKPQKHLHSFIEKLSPEEEFTIEIHGEKIIVKPWVYRYGTTKAVSFEAVSPEWASKLTEHVYIEEGLEENFTNTPYLLRHQHTI